MTDNEVILTEIHYGNIAVVTINRPESRNALNNTTMEQLRRAVAVVGDDDRIRVVVLTGAGTAFSSGGDIKQGSGGSANGPIYDRISELRGFMETSRLLHEMPKPTIAMIPGAVAGAGLSIAGACDLRIAASTSVFISAFASVGLSGDFGGTWFWTRIIGTAKARQLYLMNEKFDAEHALAFGLVNKVVSPEALFEVTMETARSIAAYLQPTLAYMKQNLNAAEIHALPEVLDLEAQNMILSWDAIVRDIRKKQQGEDR